MTNIVGRGRRLLKRMLWLSPAIDPAISCPTAFVGSSYGGYSICPDGVGPSTIVYSAGIGTDISFDLGMIAQYGAEVFAFDPTERSRNWLKTQNLPRQFHFYEFGISDHDGTAMFVPPADSAHVSYAIAQDAATAGDQGVEYPVYRLKSVMERFGHERIDILKMDIEGAEYAVLDDLQASGIEVRQILVEFHHRLPGIGVEKTASAIRRLTESKYGLFFVSPTDEEYSFLKVVS